MTTDPGGERLEQILPEIFDELRAIAQRAMRNERADHTLQPSALVNEVYLRLGNAQQSRWQSRSHFLACAAESIRRILIEHARRRNAQKRNGGRQRVSLEMVDGLGDDSTVDILELDDALRRLEALDRRLFQVVRLRFFGGLTMDEIAAVTGLSKRTVESDWSFARAWLKREITADDSGQELT